MGFQKAVRSLLSNPDKLNEQFPHIVTSISKQINEATKSKCHYHPYLNNE